MTSIRSFTSRIQGHLLAQFLSARSIALEAYTGTPAHIAKEIDAALKDRAPGTRGKLLRDIETVDRMASESGQVALGDVTLSEELEGLESAHARALWLMLNDPGRFRRAEDILYADERRYGKQWNAFLGPKHGRLSLDPETQEAFKAALRISFDTPNVHIEVFERSRPDSCDDPPGDGEPAVELTQINIYREDRPNAEHTFVDGELVLRTRAPVIEAAVMYEPATGTIECVSAHRATREDVVRGFGTTLLGCEEEFELRPAPIYNLAVLQRRQDFPTEPADGIEDVNVTLLRLHPVDSDAERITVEALGRYGGDIWSVVDQRLGNDALRTDYRIRQGKLVVRYRSDDSNRLRSLPITITHPHRSNIKEQREIERLIANKYLPRWGLLAQE